MPTEWSLHPEVFRLLVQTWHVPWVDMFATFKNAKLPTYISPVPDPRAWQVDALHVPWDDLDGYAFCPTAILPQPVQKMRTYPCQMIVVAPGWPGMAWFWDLLELSTRPPLQLPLWPNLLKQPHNCLFHHNLAYQNLHAWHLDSRSLSHLGSQPGWKVEFRSLRGSSLEWSTPHSGPYRQWCRQNQMECTTSSVPQIADFLLHLFQ